MTGKEVDERLQVLQIYRLLQYINENDRAQIETMVNLGVENLINFTEPKNGKGALHMAVAANNQDLTRFLLSLRAHPDVQNKKGHTPVMLAAELGNDGIVKMLAEHDADMKLQDSEGKGVLFYCIYPTKRHTRCMETVLEYHADVNNVSAQGTHVFQLMCQNAEDCAPMCHMMLAKGANPNATDEKTGVTALMEAAKSGSLELVRDILKRGGNPNALDQKRLSAVHYAAMGGFFEVLVLLSAFSADISIINVEECTALHFAAKTGNVNCCRFLAQRGANAKLKNVEGLLPRQIAKDAGFKPAMKELKKAEKQKANTDETLLTDLWALTLHDWSNEHESELLQAFDSPKVTGEQFTSVLTTLGAPVTEEQLELVISLHGGGRLASLNVSDFIKGVNYIKKPYLLLSYLPKKKKGGKKGKGKKKPKFVLPMPICTLPQEFKPRREDGGPPEYMMETYKTEDCSPLDEEPAPEHPVLDDTSWYTEKPDKIYLNINYLVKNGNIEALELAFSQRIPVDVQDPYYKTPLMVACAVGNLEVTRYLLQKSATVDLCDQFCWTALHHAAQAGKVEILELLLDAGADINAQTITGTTPLMIAIQSLHLSCVEFFFTAGANILMENKKEQTCLDVAVAFADGAIYQLVKEKYEAMPKPKAKGKK
ncbi:ankyrin repeat and EF-hand domain-containing protein 1a isoform X1 [Corythoichthys intestinalis]|uniref:ankyrin repeat and EF-hand domain-containing protein 1a isoform X1 n=2 Tax=Corythoichthys intestinalis TaxID=161448 RepID=UPI0025A516FE|nr:ankyrin repeat and EF-hand domain-containing protein 1a isoform X1 [Corythoichthys intestinalis]XP_057678062.1 ankyrin repeat and EF-hand domain-containing protein 1a isoform X1 [Corythoichthys intestinalis]